jgi:hypothetical protein
VIRICPSAWLRVVSWSNHFEFQISIFGFSYTNREFVVIKTLKKKIFFETKL